MTQTDDFGFGTQIRKSPYFDATVRWGAKAFSVYNHMYIPRDFGDPEQNFWNLVNDAILCDVAVERQVEITGPDAAAFVQMLTPRDLSKMAVGQCKYILITNADGGILNDPILLRSGGKPLLDLIGRQRHSALGARRGRALRTGCHDQRTRCVATSVAGPQIR